jgi:hypothetical protein
MISETDLAWMAGVLSIKGRVGLKRNKSRATSQKVVAVRTQKKYIIDRLTEMTDRNVHVDQAAHKGWDQRGCIEHCPEPHNHHSIIIPETYEWTVTGVSAAIVLWNLMPYLDGKEWEQFMTDAFSDAVMFGQGSGATKAAIRRLNTVGWKIPDQIFDLVAVAAAQPASV